ncbi:membrane protein [Streptomyces sp. CNQ-509]|uniref:membrane protein n=1 Tax=Streptomyces sp. CNQ-509 TaxID=444103 RepID=UPI00062DFA06|nr:membrane protein [Streptomyces sp. CNQ-509]AKH82425.1 membrane protein [Streptomyces sp. CNQ-509]
MPFAGIAPRRAVQLMALTTLLAAYCAQLVGALKPNVPLLVAAAAGGLALDLYLQHRQPGLLSLLSRVRFDVMVRQLLRDMLILFGLLQIDGIEPLREQSALTVMLLSSYLVHFLIQGVTIMVRRDRTVPVVTRNVDVSALGLAPAPPRILARRSSHRLLYLSVPVTVGLLTTAATADAVWGVLGLGISLALSGGGALYLATWLLPAKRTADDQRVREWFAAWLQEYQPTVGLYFSGGATSAYQANMWVSTLAALDGKPLIVLRERFMVQKITATDVPIVCLPKVADLMLLEHSTLKMLLHPANSGKTSQVLRIPTIKHAFTNHGESDKLSSCNPYAKAYDEVWVAGPAARARYQLADIGVDDRDVVEVGRPQLAPIRPYAGPPPAGGLTTVLYAPTWEGWDGNPGNTSVVLAGENIVRELLADPQVRLLYKPHPLTGSVDPRAGEANKRIQAMITEANAAMVAEAAAGGQGAGGRGAERPGPEAAAELARVQAELDELATTTFRTGADEVERMLVQSSPEAGRAEAVQAATAAWEEAYWASLPAWEHQIITDSRPGIYACFNVADVLISDVSSVISDYLTSEKPYAVANTSGMTEAEFKAEFPTVRAGTILGPRAKQIPALLEAVRDPEHDTLVRARAELKEHLLGPSEPPSLVRFNAAAVALCAKADARAARIEARGESDIPSQRRDAAEELELEPEEPAGV